MKLISIFVLSIGLLTASNTRPIEVLPAAAAVATWIVVAPTVSLFVNTVPNPLQEIGCMLVDPRDLASRYAMGGIVGGSVGTYAALAVYKALASKQSDN